MPYSIPQRLKAVCWAPRDPRTERERAKANRVRFGRKPKLSDFQRKEALTRRGAGETLAAAIRDMRQLSRTLVPQLLWKKKCRDIGDDRARKCTRASLGYAGRRLSSQFYWSFSGVSGDNVGDQGRADYRRIIVGPC
jgi:hypothetical protein